MRFLCLLLLVSATFACTEPSVGENTRPLVAPRAQLEWRDAGVLAVDPYGTSAELSLSMDESHRFVALRTRDFPADEMGEYCFRLEEGRVGEDIVLVEDGPINGPDFGFFVFDGWNLPVPGSLVLRFSVVECHLGMPPNAVGMPVPASLGVDISVGEPVSDESWGELPVRIAFLSGTTSLTVPIEEDPLWRRAWAQAETLLAPAKVRMVVERHVVLDLDVPDSLRFERGKAGIGDDIFRQVHDALSSPDLPPDFVPLILVPCLSLTEPTTGSTFRAAGQTARIPGLPAASAEHLGGVWLAVGSCSDEFGEVLPPLWSTPEHLGMILAHELGHHVGLLHVEDDADLMSAQVLRLSPSAVGLSPSQVRALRMHPSVRFSDEP